MILVLWLVISIFGQVTKQQDEMCGTNSNVNIKAVEDKTHSLRSAVAYFAQNMYLHIANTSNDVNFVFSPLSLHSALTLLYLGTTPNSITRKEMARAMGLVTNKDLLQGLYNNVVNSYDNQSSFRYGNNIWIEEVFDIKTCYIKSAKNLGAGVENINFTSAGSVDTVNDWVKSMTNNKITQLVESFSPDTKLFLANALYFNEKWLVPFKDENFLGQKLETEFRTSNGSSIRTPFIRQLSEEDLIYGEIKFGENEMEVVTVPYKNPDFEMQIILPRTVEGLKRLEGQLQIQEERDLPSGESEYFNIFLEPKNQTEDEIIDVQLTLPTFQVETKMNAVEALMKFGAERVFTPNAELENLSSSNITLYVSDIVHRAVIEVSNEGTEGAAATGVELSLFSASFGVNKNIVVDRPFIFIVQDKVNNIPVLVGRVGDPTIVTRSQK